MTTQALYIAIDACLMEQARPSLALNAHLEAGDFKQFPFDMLLRLPATEQSPLHHPEGNVWNHTLLVVDQAARRRAHSSHPRAFMWAALLHDIGKPAATRLRRGRLTAYDHDKIGETLAREFLSALGAAADLIDRVGWLVRYHMQPLFVLKNLPYQDLQGMRRHVDHREVALLSLCDRLGRTGSDQVREEEAMDRFLEACARLP